MSFVKSKTGWIAGAMLLLVMLTGTQHSVAGQSLNRFLDRIFNNTKAVNQALVRVSNGSDLGFESKSLIPKYLYPNPSKLFQPSSPTGASSANVRWEQGLSQKWYIEDQRNCEDLIVGGLIRNDPAAIDRGFKMMQWGFDHQLSDGSFGDTSDGFHSASFFVQAVARSLLVLKQSPQAAQYADQIATYTPLVHRAARWMIRPEIWRTGMAKNQPYTHRRYLVGAALGLTGRLTGDRNLIDFSRVAIWEGLNLQRSDGVNPEKGGYDSSYQMVGLVYAQHWLVYFPNDPLSWRVAAMINRGLAWERSRILPTGEISSDGNQRTAGQERTRVGAVKEVSHRSVIRGFAYWASVTGDQQWADLAEKIADYYY
ncbi:hypothetical protein [Leptolyngbya sp. NIES-2104]|uniref:hypothetical protein n=1 Tax=Leptolyngbya sp. NIES-2104 TaxID=1552121 RepID=UPI0006EC63DF|nr:hypothetical protein [Leptolyngbya sp. NIES-2104]GAP93818.1 hypothetical protein NIES2104_03270 [Leptolyngbya sp. NIES-2104]